MSSAAPTAAPAAPAPVTPAPTNPIPSTLSTTAPVTAAAPAAVDVGAASASASASASALTVRTVSIADPGPLLDLLPAQAPLSWVREGEGLVGWGEAARLDVTGATRFADAGAWWSRLCALATTADDVAEPGTGLVAFGTFEFAADPWRADDADGTDRPSSLIVPSVVIGRRGGTWWLTTATAGAPQAGGGAERVSAQSISSDDVARAPQGIRWADGTCTGAEWQDAVGAALELIDSGAVQKVVLARDKVAGASAPLDPRWALRRLGALYPTCWTFAVDGLIGATPELLVSLHEGTVRSRVLAGTIGRPDPAASADDLAQALRASSKDLREHEFSVHSLVDALRPHCTHLDAPAAPFVLTLPNVLHLASDVVGAASPGATSLDLAAAVHPTAAVCGVPRAAAGDAIEALEPMRRARYAGPVGWLSAGGDGEWGVALRCGQIDALDPSRIRIFAGAGIVAQSAPAAELAETEAKFAPMIAALQS